MNGACCCCCSSISLIVHDVEFPLHLRIPFSLGLWDVLGHFLYCSFSLHKKPSMSDFTHLLSVSIYLICCFMYLRSSVFLCSHNLIFKQKLTGPFNLHLILNAHHCWTSAPRQNQCVSLVLTPAWRLLSTLLCLQCLAIDLALSLQEFDFYFSFTFLPPYSHVIQTWVPVILSFQFPSQNIHLA